MFKLLRKYDKWILAIGGSLLMVVFLLPQALQQFGTNPQKATAATYDGGKKITEKDRIDAQREIAMLESISPLITQSILQLGVNPDEDENDLSPALHWLLLTRDAKADGLIGGIQDGRNFLEVAAKFFARQYVLQNRFSLDLTQFADIEEQVKLTYAVELETARTAFINRSGTPPIMVDRTLAKARGVLRMYESYLSFDQPSLQESLDLSHRFFDEAEIMFYTLGSDSFIDPAYTPDDTEILVHYSKFKEDLPGEGEFGFGYRSEDRVRLEWLRISRQEISDAVIVDPVDANTRWRRNRTQYPGEFADERSNVEKDIRNERTDAILREAERYVRAELLKARGGLTQNPDGTYDLPAGWIQNRTTFLTIAQTVGKRLRDKYGPSMPNPSALDDSSQWRTRAQTRGIPIVGNSTRIIGPRNVPMVDLAFSVPEIDPEALHPIQTGIAQGPLTASQTGDLIFFRVTEASRSAPQPLAEVRDHVIEDIRRLLAYERLKAQIPRMISEIVTAGFESAAETRGAKLYEGATVKRDVVSSIDPLTAPPTFIIQRIDTETFRDAVMDRVESFPINEPLSRRKARELLLGVPLDDRREVAIVGIVNFIPLTTEAHRMIEAQALQIHRTREMNLNTLEAWPYSASQMLARHQVIINRRADVDVEDEATADAPGGAPVTDAESDADAN